MQCKNSTRSCNLELKFYENGDVLEFCTVCNFSYLHKVKNIKDSQLNPYTKKD